MSLRSWLYWLARKLGDANAIAKGKFVQRYARRRAIAGAAGIINRFLK